jgi:hypothetical protein
MNLPDTLGPKARWALAGVVVLACAMRLAHFNAIVHSAYPKFPEELVNSDMHTFLRWSDTILAGDLLGRDTYHPYVDWMQVAPLEDWYQWWGGKGVYQQEPFYAYFVASTRKLFNGSVAAV